METTEEKIQNFRPFNQIPQWSSDSIIKITGKEFETIYNFISLFGPAVATLNTIFQRGVSEGIINIKNEYADNEDHEEVPDEVMRDYYQQLKEAIEAQNKSE